MWDYETFKVELDESIALVRIDRPPVNAMNRRMREECIEVFSKLSDHPTIRAVVLTGSGHTFCGGADRNERPDPGTPGAYPIHNRLTRESFQSIAECAKPVIAAINGPAIAAGFVLASCCDILLVAEDAWISMPEVEVGLAGGVRHFRRHFGESDARLLMFTGRRVSGRQLQSMGVTSQCLPAAELLAGALDLAKEIAGKSPSAVRAAKSSFLVTEELSLHSGYRFEQSQTAVLAQGADHLEAQRAFKEKRKPVF